MTTIEVFPRELIGEILSHNVNMKWVINFAIASKKYSNVQDGAIDVLIRHINLCINTIIKPVSVNLMPYRSHEWEPHTDRRLHMILRRYCWVYSYLMKCKHYIASIIDNGVKICIEDDDAITGDHVTTINIPYDLIINICALGYAPYYKILYAMLHEHQKLYDPRHRSSTSEYELSRDHRNYLGNIILKYANSMHRINPVLAQSIGEALIRANKHVEALMYFCLIPDDPIPKMIGIMKACRSLECGYIKFMWDRIPDISWTVLPEASSSLAIADSLCRNIHVDHSGMFQIILTYLSYGRWQSIIDLTPYIYDTRNRQIHFARALAHYAIGQYRETIKIISDWLPKYPINTDDIGIIRLLYRSCKRFGDITLYRDTKNAFVEFIKNPTSVIIICTLSFRVDDRVKRDKDVLLRRYEKLISNQ
jgi:hypothetical protein